MAAIKSASFDLLHGDIHKLRWALAIPTSLSDLHLFEGQNDARKVKSKMVFLIQLS